MYFLCAAELLSADIFDYFLPEVSVSGGTFSVHCLEIGGCPYHFYGKINRGHIVCPVYGGGPYLGESVMRCSTVIIWTDAYTFISLASYIVCTPSPIHYAEFHVHVCVATC